MKNIQEIPNQKFNIMYSRVSGISQQNNTSLPYQQSVLTNYCKDGGVMNTIHIVDVDSGSIDRKGIEEIKSLIAMNLVEAIYITKLDRLYRSIVRGSSFIKLCLDNDVKIITALETTDTSTSAGLLQIHLLLSICDYERLCIKDRTWAGKVSSFKNGNRCQGNIAYGYDKDKNGIIQNKIEASIIKLIFNSYRKLNSVGKVKDIINSKGYTTKRNKHFTRKSIYNILTNRFYVGDVSLKGEYHIGNHQAIISKNLYTRTINQLTNNKKG